ncbi:hypothetical protein HY640_04315 [Candidatus Woesearchaeota archaeon]|nr:hypothetical protein [Candidatus Woesearchaeota archaeon]
MSGMLILEDKLYTPIITYSGRNTVSGGKYTGCTTVKVISTIHIGTPQYYERLSAEIDRLPMGLYEGIKVSPEESVGTSDWAKTFNYTNNTVAIIADVLGLVVQSLEYPSGWRNPDYSLDEVIQKAGAVPRAYSGLANPKRHIEVIRNNPEEIKAIFAYSFRIVGSPVVLAIKKAFPGITKSNILVDERDKALLQSLEQYAEQAEIGIVYGVIHLPAIQSFLSCRGFKKTNVEWVEAMNLQHRTSLLKTIAVLMQLAKA